MLSRQEKLLQKIIQEYIKTAEPVGSLKLARDIQVSSATVRNEMVELEESGFIFQPHTSAGRVPTEKGYFFYVSNFIKDVVLSDEEKKVFEAAMKRACPPERRSERAVKNLAQKIAEFATEAVIVAFNPNNLYFTGLSNLFAKPEFVDRVSVTSVSQILDKSEQVLPQIIDLVSRQEHILIGSNNPFGNQCSFVATPFGSEGFFGILGPMRMDYEKNLSIINFVKELI
ncbi:MAG: hypothetical protein AAB568_01865 [Patescibacteria group bacterium]